MNIQFETNMGYKDKVISSIVDIFKGKKFFKTTLV